jgi:putative ABC transport system permease protein
MWKIIQSIIVGIKMSFLEMTSHVLRSILSILGVMLGVASLVSMLTLVGGVNKFLHEKMGHWAGSVWFWMLREPPSDQDRLIWSRSPKLHFSDGIYLENKSEDVSNFYTFIQRYGPVYISGKRDKSQIKGVDRFSLEDDLRNARISKGRTISDEEFNNAKMVCLISWMLEERILNKLNEKDTNSTLIGQKCVYNNKYFTIVGVFEPEDPDFKPRHLRRSIFVPVSAMQKYVTGLDPNPGSIRLSVKDPAKLHESTENIARILKSHHRGVEDFEYRAAEWLEEIRNMLLNASLLMTIVAVISLIVGGLSIMNVMLSSISERIYEIGIRKALGAKGLQIFIQFITESTILSFCGGFLGITLGTLPLFFKESIKKSTDGSVEPTLLLTHVIFVCCIIMIVGIIFGLYPAVKASRMNPIEALRYE